MGEDIKKLTEVFTKISNKSNMDRLEEEIVKHPSHYNQGRYEAIDVIDDWNLNFSLGNVIKYIARADHKGNKLEDLKKARFYIDYEIAKCIMEDINERED